MEYMQLSLDDYIQCKNDIKNNLGTIVKSFARIGWQLSRIDKSGAYKNDGYNTIAEFAKAGIWHECNRDKPVHPCI